MDDKPATRCGLLTALSSVFDPPGLGTPFQLKLQSNKLYNNKCMITSTQITKTEFFKFIAVLAFKLLSYKILCINRKGNRNI